MHKLNIYGTWDDNEIFWTNNLANCSKSKKLKKDNKTAHLLINGRINKSSRVSPNFNEPDKRNSDKTGNTNSGPCKTIKNSKKKENNTVVLLSKNNKSFYYK